MPSGLGLPRLDPAKRRLARPGEVVSILPGVVPLVRISAKDNPWSVITYEDDKGCRVLSPTDVTQVFVDCSQDSIVS